MRVLVTGGAGFIGSHIVDRLIEDGIEAVVVDNLSSGKIENINPKAAFYEADIRDKAKVAEIFARERPDIVDHHAAQVSVRESVADPCFDADVNITGSINILENCRKAGVKRFVFASSGGAIYGEQDVFPAAEDHPAWPLSPYGAAKLAVEKYMFIYKKEYGLDYVALRYSNVYGPRQDPHGEAGVVAIFSGLMLEGRTPTVNGDGEQTRDYVFVGDVVRANMLAIKGAGCGSYNVATGLETSVNTLYELMIRCAGYSGGKMHGPAKPGEQRRSVLDCGLIKKELGWSPEVELGTGLGDTVEFFRGRT